ncbi:MAG TPA: flagellar basal body L-ring protein FlgH [Leptospiraceae bacterium]|nr:flagellar basal body L-ring protein FlgH [Leptospiraceae bacterium]HMX35177.1 flagellar basal body L-ring protein FlgH [Leptospiraceae bacterium]HMY32272.1 flagellar basal body L-ring protein FlgH [Leptospiraceae bacterium]HMZ63961.1 flagellar basal body L-ring protein FlgH [Leptospiraceae bacterium]HNA10401.1 flagellar basal body L-ring protein FlgH [Leptospiraceae bacterium]
MKNRYNHFKKQNATGFENYKRAAIHRFAMVKNLCLLFIIFLLSVVIPLGSQSLWVDKNPYANGQDIRLGSVIRVLIKDGMKGDYVYEGGKDDSFVIRSHPDKKIVDEMKGFTADRSFAHRQNGKSKSTAKIIGAMSVLVTQVDPVSGLLTLAGTREVGFDNAKNSLKLSGIISPLDVRDDKTVTSDMVANLKIEYATAPNKESLNEPDIQLKTKKNANGTETIQKAELSNEEKQKIILKNMKRLLGESQ